MKDQLGQEIKIGDVVAFGMYGRDGGLYFAEVTGFTPKMVRIVKRHGAYIPKNLAHPASVVVLNLGTLKTLGVEDGNV